LIKKILEEEDFNSLVKNHFDNVIDAVFMLTGLCGSIVTISGTQGISHPLYNAFSYIPELRKKLHGEKISFALSVQALLEEQEDDEIKHRIKLFHSLDMPLTFEELGFGVDAPLEIQIKDTAQKVKDMVPSYPALTRPYTVSELEAALYKASALAKAST